MAETRSRSHPVAISKGALSLIGAWFVGLAIVRLTGAAAVVLLLVAALVAMIAASVSGWWRLRSVSITGIVTPTASTVGEPIAIVIAHAERHRSTAPVRVSVIAQLVTLDDRSPTSATLAVDAPGVLTELSCSLESAGLGGLVRWRRRQVVRIDTLHVAPIATGPILPVDRNPTTTEGAIAAGIGPKVGELDGSRPWRPGESQQAIHWPSTLRAGEVIAFDRSTATDSRWSVSGDADAARLRWTLEEGLRSGHEVVLTGVVSIGGAESDTGDITIHNSDDVLRWSAIAADRQTEQAEEQRRSPLWKREFSLIGDRTGKRVDQTLEAVNPRARLLTGAAAVTAIVMLLGALGSGAADRVFAVIGIAVATAVSLGFSGRSRPWWARASIVFIAAAALGRIAVQASGVGGLLEALRGPMPDLLILLVVLHGAEINDRRTTRVHLAITGVVVAYATGLRIDGSVGWWMLSWGVLTIAAFCALDTDRRMRLDRGAVQRIATWTSVGALCTIGLAAFVPVPDGPASLGLPAISNDDARVDGNGALVGPDGTPTPPTSTGEQTRGALGEVGGYPGFSNTLDTSVRGDLGDEIVMRVRAPEPAFWRGQTFSEFDGRVWTVSDATSTPLDGPTIKIAPTLGDVTGGVVGAGSQRQDFVQTYHVEADLPNVIFAAAPPNTVIFDGTVFARSDGSIRADRTLAKGTVYSVVSDRVDVTPESLRAEKDLGPRFAPFADEPEVSQFLSIPESTSPETVALATQLRIDGSTYDTIRAYEAWIGANTEYDLDAPVPQGDAVDDFLFRSQRGFCEQIASSLIVMLRSQGVPARLATGYIPGTRDQISGVFEVRASDAHAWVEVWFPDSGWQPFDPTASVPLSGDAQRSTVGADAASAVIAGIASHPIEIALVAFAASGLAAGMRRITAARQRRARGAWGVLHDRFIALTPDEQIAPRAARKLAETLGDNDEVGDPQEIATALDRVAFDPAYDPSDDERRQIEGRIAVLERVVRANATSS
jgi:protein-glutamine gamma-glutamyltransferase